MSGSQTFFVTVMANDRPGMMAHIGRCFADLGGGILDLSQTVMRGHFTVIVFARFPVAVSEEQIRAALLQVAPDLSLGVQRGPGRAEESGDPGQRLFLTARGQDRHGLVADLGTFLAGRDINIEDMYARVDPESGAYVMIIQMRCPPEGELRQLQLDLAELADDLGMIAHLQHENVFLATNEIRAVRALTL